MEGNTLISEFTNSVHSSATSELLVSPRASVPERSVIGFGQQTFGMTAND